MVEIIAVIVIMGILSASTVGIVINMREDSFAERLLLAHNLRYARRLSLDSTSDWGIRFSGNTYTLTENGSPSGSFPSTGSRSHTSNATLPSGLGSIVFNQQKGTLVASSAQIITFENGARINVYTTGCIQ